MQLKNTIGFLCAQLIVITHCMRLLAMFACELTLGSTNAFLIKVDAVTGVTQWGSRYGVTDASSMGVVPTDVAADPVNGNVYIAGQRSRLPDRCVFALCLTPHVLAGTITNPASAVTPYCNSIANNNNCGANDLITRLAQACPVSLRDAGVDLFNLGSLRKVGCPQDPRPVLSTLHCPSCVIPLPPKLHLCQLSSHFASAPEVPPELHAPTES